jgi:hypothetical protein
VPACSVSTVYFTWQALTRIEIAGLPTTNSMGPSNISIVHIVDVTFAYGVYCGRRICIIIMVLGPRQFADIMTGDLHIRSWCVRSIDLCIYGLTHIILSLQRILQLNFFRLVQALAGAAIEKHFL